MYRYAYQIMGLEFGTARKVLGTQDQPTYGPAPIMCY